MAALDSKHYSYKRSAERPSLRVIRDRKTYNLFGMGHMTAGQIVALFATAALAVFMIWAGIWLFCAVMYAFGIES